jgi:uncharacterized protein (DUF1778 family)
MIVPVHVPPKMPNAKVERLEARVSLEQKRLIQQAAELEGRTVTEFLVNTAQAAAKQVIEEHEMMRLTAQDRELFVSALLNPPVPSKKLQAAARSYKEKTRG